MRQLIKRILKEEREKDLSPKIKELLNASLLEKYEGWVCTFSVIKPTNRPYTIAVFTIGGVDSKHWPVTQFVRNKRENIVNDVWQTVYNYLGVESDVNLIYVKSCDEVLTESLEDIQGMPLYHHTTESRAVSIMNTNMLRGTRPDDDILAVDPTLDNTQHQSMVSFTRDKNFVPNGTIGASAGGLGDSKKLSVIFVVDKDKLKSNYKIVPFDYSALEDRWYDKRVKDEPDTIMQPKAIRTSKSNEYEERVLTNKIQPLRRYVTDIIYKGDNPLVQEKIDEFLGREKQEEKEGAGAYDAPAFAMEPDHTTFKHEQKEAELTERCWKGYTQKGMKTMFGKRYPNCVKKTK